MNLNDDIQYIKESQKNIQEGILSHVSKIPVYRLVVIKKKYVFFDDYLDMVLVDSAQAIKMVVLLLKGIV